MEATLIDGKKISEEIRAELKIEVDQLKSQGMIPGLGVILVGENPASEIYVRNKERACEKTGIHTVTKKPGADISQDELLHHIDQWNEDSSIHGILVQLPLPKHIDEHHVIERITPHKDVDGFHPYNVGRMMTGAALFLPCTPAGIQELLLRSGADPRGKHVVIVGRSNIVGKPLCNILMQKAEGANATVTICHTGTPDISQFTKQADILVVAAGRPEVVKGDMVRRGAVVVDVGVNRVEDSTQERGYRIVGDVEFESVRKVASAITPVPGGVGPMTIAMLLRNTVRACKLQSGIESTGYT
ncbi:methenyltetrahydrofolate cyclohydrolase [candidate division TA06 bacterium DG_26]|uniref:Bifunctional protein FolD n=1 Tax=candidate division TA06 bacterium DG_26 TaxID=1703771 RepID=A0A0S7WL89_UNCT6|nr:MAG: methenyltetrahydrofolate cyclohydrolase [candidate division TA06 bacterium DG_26]